MVERQPRDYGAPGRTWSAARERVGARDRPDPPAPGNGSYRCALAHAKAVSPAHVPCSWCGQPTLGPEEGVVLCPGCRRARR
jgi:hypothetical protein